MGNNSKLISFSELCPFYDLDFLSPIKHPTRALASACVAFVPYGLANQNLCYIQIYKILERKDKCSREWFSGEYGPI